MAGKIVADQLEHSTAGSLNTQFVVNGTPKGFCHFNQVTPAITNSLNASSLTDTAAGHGSVNWASAMSDANYTCTTGNKTVAATTAYAVVLNDDVSYVTRTASVWSFNSYYISGSTNAAFDSSSAICSAMGDLA